MEQKKVSSLAFLFFLKIDVATEAQIVGCFLSDRKPNLMVTTRRKIGNFKSRILVSAEQARNETFLSLSLLSAEAFPCFLIHILVKCAKVLLKRQYRLPRSNGTQGEQIGIDLFVSRSSRKMFKLATFTTQVSQKKNN